MMRAKTPILLLVCLTLAACAQTRRERAATWYLPDAEPIVCGPEECLDDERPTSLDAALDANEAGDTDTGPDAAEEASADASVVRDSASDAGCAPGFAWNAKAAVCQDFDECAIDNGGCGDATYFHCSNRPGPQPHCEDIDECAAPDACHGYACTNLRGAPPLCASNCPGDSDDVHGDGSLCLSRVQQVTGESYGYQCALLKDGSLRCWGRIAPTQQWPKEKFSQISGADRQICGLSQGAVLCWYLNSTRDVQRTPDTGRKLVTLNYPDSYLLLHHDGSLVNSAGAPNPAATYRDVDSAAGRHCAIESSGKLVCWGGWQDEQLAPIAALTEHGFSAVAVGPAHVCALRESGALRCFGISTDAAVNQGPHVTGPNAETATDFSQVAVGGHTCALHRDGKIQCWGGDRPEINGPNASTQRFVRMSVEGHRTCAFTERDSMRCWGADMGLVRHANSEGIERLLEQRTGGVRKDGSLVFPNSELSAANVPGATPAARLRDFVYTSRGSCVLQDDGRMLCWGQPGMTTLEEAAQNERFVSITGSNRDSVCGLHQDGSARCFKTSTGGLLDTALDQLAADAGRYQTLAVGDVQLCVLRDSGRLACWGADEPATNGPNASTESYVALAVGASATCALSSQGRIRCWAEKDVEFADTFPQDFTQIALQYTNLYGLRKNGSIYAYDVQGRPISSGFEWLPQRFTQLVSTDDGVCALSSAGDVVCRGQYYLDGDALVTARR